MGLKSLVFRERHVSTMISQYISFGILLFFFLRGKTQSSWHRNILPGNLPCIRIFLQQAFPSNDAAGTEQRVHHGVECTGSCLRRYCHRCHERGIPYFQFRIQCGPGYRSGLPAGILLQLWGKEVFPCKESVLVHPVRQPGDHGSVCRVVYVFRRELLLEFLTDMDAYEIAFYALQIQCLTLPFIPVCICGNMLFQSIGKGGRATILASFRSGTIYIPALLILTAFFGLRGIQWSQPVSDILSVGLSLPVAVVFLRGLPEDGT